MITGPSESLFFSYPDINNAGNKKPIDSASAIGPVKEMRNEKMLEAARVAKKLSILLEKMSDQTPVFSTISEKRIVGTTVSPDQNHHIFDLLNEEKYTKALKAVVYGTLLQMELNDRFGTSSNIPLTAINEMNQAKKELLELFSIPTIDTGVINTIHFKFQGFAFDFSRDSSGNGTLNVDTSTFEKGAQDAANTSMTIPVKNEQNIPRWQLEMFAATRPISNPDYFTEPDNVQDKNDLECVSLFAYLKEFVTHFHDYGSYKKELLDEISKFTPAAKRLVVTELIRLIDEQKDDTFNSFKSEVQELFQLPMENKDDSWVPPQF